MIWITDFSYGFTLTYLMCRLVEFPHFSLLLSNWILAARQIDLCMKNAILCEDTPPSFRFSIRPRPIVSQWRIGTKRDFCTFSITTQLISLVSQIRNLRMKLRFSYRDQFVMQPIFNYLTRANDVEICLAYTIDWHDN